MYNWHSLQIIQLQSKLTLIQKHLDKYKQDIFINYDANSVTGKEDKNYIQRAFTGHITQLRKCKDMLPTPSASRTNMRKQMKRWIV
jgi:hypothetical protein